MLSDEQYYEALEEFGDEFSAKMGAEAVQDLMADLDVNEDANDCAKRFPQTNSETKIKKLSKRLKLMEAFVNSGNKPEWMVSERTASSAAGSASAGTSGRWSFCDL